MVWTPEDKARSEEARRYRDERTLANKSWDSCGAVLCIPALAVVGGLGLRMFGIPAEVAVGIALVVAIVVVLAGVVKR